MKFDWLCWDANCGAFARERFCDYSAGTDNGPLADTGKVDYLNTCTTIYALLNNTLTTDIASRHKCTIIFYHSVVTESAGQVQNNEITNLYITSDNGICTNDASPANLHIILITNNHGRMNQSRVLNEWIIN